MRPISIGGGASGSSKDQIAWILRALRTIEQASNDADISIIAQNFSITGAFTPTRTLDAGSPTLANVVAVLATFIQDHQKGGSNRTT